MRIRWTPEAAADLEELSVYLQEKLPRHRESTLRLIYRKIQGLKRLPQMGRVGAVEGTRELLFVPLPWVVVDAVKADAVEILRIQHLRRNLRR